MRRHPLPETTPPVARTYDRDRDHGYTLKERGAVAVRRLFSGWTGHQSTDRVFLRLRYFSLSSSGTNRSVMMPTATTAHRMTMLVASWPRPALSAQLGLRPTAGKPFQNRIHSSEPRP